MSTLLFGLAVRRIRLRTVLFALGAAALVGGTARSFAQIYPTARERETVATALGGDPALRALLGAPGDLSVAGGYTVWRVGGVLAVVVRLYALLTLTALTRGEEEAGLREAVWAGAVRRVDPLAAAVAATALGCVVVGAVVAAGMAAAGAGGTGALALGAACAAFGWVFTGVAAWAAQVATTRRGAAGLAGAVLGAAYAVRLLADAGRGRTALEWASPFGWFQRVDSYGADDLRALLPPVAVAVVLVAAALAAEGRRDLGAGLRGTRPGPAHSRALRGPATLAARLHAGTLLAWSVALALGGAVLGGLAGSVADLVAGDARTTELLQRLGGGAGDPGRLYLGGTFQLVGALVALVAAQGVLAARREEASGRADALLSRPVGRARWLGAQLVVGLVSAAVVGFVAAGAGALTWAAVGGRDTVDLLGAAANALPTAVLFAGLAAALIGLRPRLAVPGTLGALGLAFVLDYVGRLAGFSDAVLAVSPFHHVGSVPAGAVDVAGAVVLTGVGLVLAAVGLVAVRRRDVVLA